MIIRKLNNQKYYASYSVNGMQRPIIIASAEHVLKKLSEDNADGIENINIDGIVGFGEIEVDKNDI